MKVATIVGARPQFIKAAPVSTALVRAGIDEVLVHTGQHYDASMSDVFFTELGIASPTYNLGVGGGSHGEQTGKMLEGVEDVLLRERPDWLLVYGDTNSTLAGALAAAKLHIPIAHVEAGLRSFNRRMPEEVNRILSDHVASLLLAPTSTAVSNLLREGIPEKRIRQVGDVMYDAARYYGNVADERSQILKQLEVQSKGYVLATIHRAENTDDPGRLTAIVEALSALSERIPVIVPVHPRTRNRLQALGASLSTSGRVTAIDPVGYLDMVMLEKNASLVVTDSGGVQKEAFFHGVKCVTVRDETEWVELVELGWNFLAPPKSADAVIDVIEHALRAEPNAAGQPYGEGDAADRIADALSSACEY